MDFNTIISTQLETAVASGAEKSEIILNDYGYDLYITLYKESKEEEEAE